jgi:acetate kinase
MNPPSLHCPLLLVLNVGSSSIKAALFENDSLNAPRPLLHARVDSYGSGSSRLTVEDVSGAKIFESATPDGESYASLRALLDWLEQAGYASRLCAAGHRLVHGGPRYKDPHKVTPEMVAALKEIAPLDPDHTAAALDAIRCVSDKFPHLPQVACFDTAFHSTMPAVARMYALPWEYYNEGIARYGFHGLSCESILHQLRSLEPDLADGRLIVAHLGSGASVTAIRGGKSVDTSMGFTPLEGLVMGTRAGDLDPGLVLYLVKQRGMSPEEADHLLNKQSGLLGVSGDTADMRLLLERRAREPRAAAAIDLFCYRVKKYIGAYAAVLGGVEILVFSGGIGERAAAIRERICSGLNFLGVEIDAQTNQSSAPVISGSHSLAKIRVMTTDEEQVIARHMVELLAPAQV